MITLPDILEIKPLTRPPNATITVPGSKSITNRALILAALAKGKCTLRGALWADDTQVMVESLEKLGFDIQTLDEEEECNKTITIVGRNGEIPRKEAKLYVGNAGTAARFLTALVCLSRDGIYEIDGDSRMRQRPMSDLFAPLRQLGADIPGNTFPVTIRTGEKGLRTGEVTVVARRSSQFASALLLIARHAGLIVDVAETAEVHGYIAMTRRMLEQFQLGDPSQYQIEPDLSSASYFDAIESIMGGRIEVKDRPTNPLQIDGRFREFLPLPVRVSRQTDLGDSVMTLAICALAKGKPLRLTEAGNMREQECNRLNAMVTELRRVGGKAKETEDGFVMEAVPTGQLHSADIETYRDHRMAMSFAVLGLKIPGIRIKNPACVSKTFPNFFDKLKQLGAELIDGRTRKPI